MHPQPVLIDQLLIICMDGCRMPGTVNKHLLAHVERLVFILCLQQRMHRAELLKGQRLVGANLPALCHKDSCIIGDREPRLLRDPLGGFSGDSRVQLRLGRILACICCNAEHVLFKFCLFFCIDEISFTALHLFDQRRIDIFMRNNSLFSCADHTVIKMLGKDQIVDGTLHINIIIHISRGIACTHAKSRFAGSICSMDHSGAACSKDRGHTGMLHQGAGSFNGGVFDPLDTVFGGTCSNCRITDYPGSFRRAFLSVRMEPEYDRTARFQSDQRLKDHC